MLIVSPSAGVHRGKKKHYVAIHIRHPNDLGTWCASCLMQITTVCESQMSYLGMEQRSLTHTVVEVSKTWNDWAHIMLGRRSSQ